jgi:hypothetical protein
VCTRVLQAEFIRTVQCTGITSTAKYPGVHPEPKGMCKERDRVRGGQGSPVKVDVPHLYSIRIR